MAVRDIYEVTLRQLEELRDERLYALPYYRDSWSVGDYLIVSHTVEFGRANFTVFVEGVYRTHYEVMSALSWSINFNVQELIPNGMWCDYEVWRVVEEAPEPADLYVMSFLDHHDSIVREERFSDRDEWVECGACSVMEYDWTYERTLHGWTDYHGNTYDNVHVVYMRPCPVAAC